MSLPGLSVFVGAAGTATAFYIDFCNLAFQCGCRSLWNGAADFCNIHHAGVRHCPWCSTGYWGLLPLLSIVLLQGAVAFWPRPLPFVIRLTLAFALFPVVGGLLALVFGGVSGYWNPTF